MTTINIKHFDKLSFVDEAKEAGFTEQQARLVAKKLEIIQENTEIASSQILNKELQNVTTKSDIKDIRIEMKELEMRLIKWLVGITIISVTTTVSTIFTLLKFFH